MSGARWWAQKPTHLLEEAIRVVRACLRIIEQSTPAWWVIENPVGRLAKCVPELGAPAWTFDPCDYGDPWTKKTCLWGQFTAPAKQERPNDVGWCPGWRLGPSSVRQTLRSITPLGFAQAFFESNP